MESTDVVRVPGPDTAPNEALPEHPRTPVPASRLRRAAGVLSFRNTSAIYVLAVFLVIFAFWIPDLFFTATTFKTLLYQQAVTAVVALGFLLPFTAGNFDLSLGSQVGVSSAVSGWLLVEHGLPIPIAIVAAILVCVAIGAINGFLVEIARIDAVIATLAMMVMLDAVGDGVTKGKQFLGLPDGFLRLSSRSMFGVSIAFVYVVVIGLILWWVLRQTPVGRHLYAIGGNREAARLAGTSVRTLVFSTFLGSSMLAAIAGVLVTARVGAGDFAVGHGYIFPAAAAVFLGSTQIRPGVFNVWGTVVAVYVLAAIVKGLQLGGAPFWLPDFANGFALALAVGISSYGSRAFQRKARVERIRRLATARSRRDAN